MGLKTTVTFLHVCVVFLKLFVMVTWWLVDVWSVSIYELLGCLIIDLRSAFRLRSTFRLK